MAYITPTELRRNLPRNGIGLEDPELNAFVNEWVERLGLGLPAGTEVAESSISRSVVRVGATADAKKMMAARDSYLETPGLDAEISRAERLLREYRASTPTPEDDAFDTPQGYTGVMPF